MPNDIRLATYNLKNFSIYDSNHQKFEIKYSALLWVLNEMNADILALQEIDGVDSLEALNYDLENSYPHISFHKTNSQREIHFAFMSRYPYKTTSHKETLLRDENNKKIYEYISSENKKKEPVLFSRDVLQADVQISENQKISVFNLHLKSNLHKDWKNYDSHKIRHAESNATVKIVKNIEKSSQDPIVILGDFNQSYGHHTISPLNPGLGYYDVIESELNQSDKSIFTFRNRFMESRIDHVLLSPKAKECYIKDTIKIHNHYPAEKASDHYPVHFILKS